MKRITPFVLLIILLSNCHEPKDAASESAVSPFNKNVGMKIPMDVAQRWIAKYRSQDNARTEAAPVLSPADLDVVINPLQEKLGVSFHRAVDAGGGYHILVVAVEEGVSQWESDHVLDASTNTLIAANVAAEWADRYKTGNPQGIWSHFFGIRVFEEEFNTVELVEAQNDEGVPQMLLFVSRGGSSGNGRTQGQTVDVYDASAPCPPTCNGSEI